METIKKEFATYTLTEVTPACFTTGYVLIKNGKEWGTFHHIRKGTNVLHWKEHSWGGRTGHEGFTTRDMALSAIEANEARLRRKYGNQ